MTMTNEEIVRDYRQAKDPAQAIQILADLNCAGRKDIVRILQSGGAQVPARFLGTVSDKIRPLYDQGLSDREIALRLRCSCKTVGKWRKQNGGLPPAGRRNGSKGQVPVTGVDAG